ncbi:MAG TPA: hypothetical protein DCG57_13395 [Candidatus Riflebacteria bacterium]|jgi:hypothetical protein|nr:hypothetical protein [Candidatus Riflebacteria bacterium]
MNFRKMLQQKAVDAILSRVADPDANRICKHVLQSGCFSHLLGGSIFIPADLIVDELNRYSESVPGLCIQECALTDEKIVLKISHDSIGDLRPVIGIRFTELCVNDKIQTIKLEYEINDSLDDGLLTYIFKPLIRIVATVFIKRNLAEIEFLEGFHHTETGGWVKVDLARIEEFRNFQIIPGFNHRLFSIITFSTIKHSSQGIEIVCDTTFRQLASNLYQLLIKKKTSI